MADINFTTHLFKEFTEKYGDVLQSFFVKDALMGKYLSAGELYHYLFPEATEENLGEQLAKEQNDNSYKLHAYRVSPNQSAFNKKCIGTVCLVNKLFREKGLDEYKLRDFFVGELENVKYPRNTEFAYWESLFVNAWVSSQNRDFERERKYFESCKEEIVESVITIIEDLKWHEFSLWNNVLWSIELFRLRFLLDKLVDDSFDFLYVLDWIDIFEYRIAPRVLANVSEKIVKNDEKMMALRIYHYFMKVLNGVIVFPFAERYGLTVKQKRSVWSIRKCLLPIKGHISDVNMKEDKEIYANLVDLLKNKVGKSNTSSEVCKSIRSIIAERNRYRDCLHSNGESYSFIYNEVDFAEIDAEFIDSSLKLYTELIKEKNIDDTENILTVLTIYHMIRFELAQEERDDFPNPFRKQQNEELMQIYFSYRKEIIKLIFQNFTDCGRLLMDVMILDIGDDLLAEMIMVGSKLLKKNMSDDVLSKLFHESPNRMDEERNSFINQSWSSFGVEDRVLYSLFVNGLGKMERIRGYVDDDKLNSEEMEYISTASAYWEKEVTRIHEMLYFDS